MKLSNHFNPILTSSTFSLQPIEAYISDFFYREQLSIVFIESGYGKGKINDEIFEFVAPSVICINETEHLHLDKSVPVQGKVLTFSPNSIRSYFTFENIREFDHAFTPEDIHLAIYLSIFFKRFPLYTGYVQTSESLMKDLNKTLEQLSQCSNLHQSSSDLLIELIAPIKYLVQTSLSISEVIITDSSFEIKDVLLYLHNNCKQKITIPKLSKQFHINRTTLSNKFFEATGETIINYLNKYRINLAAIMLRESNYSISDIAEQVGFNDTAYFAKLFKKYMLHTPSGYRQRYVALCQAHKVNDLSD